jgi:hypothetical protein
VNEACDQHSDEHDDVHENEDCVEPVGRGAACQGIMAR